SPEKTRLFISQLRERVAALPGVTSVSFVDSIPLSIGGVEFDFNTKSVKDPKRVDANVYTVGADYFSTMGIPLRRGRDFELRRDTGATLIVNEEMAAKLFPGEDPLGKQVQADAAPGQPTRTLEVIGVARNSKSRTLGEGNTPAAYLFLEPKPEDVFSFFGITIVVRTVPPPSQLANAVRDEIHALDPNLPVFNGETMTEHVNKSMLLPRLCATLLGIFGAV